MADPVGRYVQIAVDTPENIQSFGLVKEIDTSQLTLPSGSSFVSTAISQVQNCRIIHGRLQSNAISQNQAILDGMGFARKQKAQYSIVTEGSTYNCPITVDEFCGALNRHFEPVEMGEKPIDWDTNKGWKYWEKVQTGTIFSDRPYYRIAREPWSATTQYYSNTQDFHFYYIIDGDKKVRVGVGDTGLTHDNHRMGMQIAHKEAGDGNYSGFNDAFWTFINGETEQIIKAGTTSNEYYDSEITTSEVSAINTLFAGNQMNRYLFNTGYNTGWRSSVTDEQKGQWRTRVHNEVRIKNVTTTQFGFLNHDGHRYFGIWVCYPQAQFYVGYKQYESASDNPISTATSLADLRSYNYDNPIPDTEMVKWGNVYFYGVELDALNVTLQEKEGQLPPDVNPDLPEVSGWTALKPILPTKRSLGSLAKSNEPGFHVWDVTESVYKQFLGNLWNWGSPGANVWEQLNEDGFIKNPIAGITGAPISIVKGLWESAKESKVDPLAAIQTCFALPGYINTQVQNERDQGNIKIAGLNLGDSFKAYCCNSETYVWTASVSTSGLGVTQSYLDTAPYSTAEVYLPYIGMVQINPADCLGGSIDITYSTCVVDGTISATIVCHTGLAESNPTQYGPYTSNAAYRIPIAQKDANAFDRSMGYMSAIGTGLGGVFNVVKGSLSTLASNPRNQNAIMEQGMANIGTYANSSKSMIGQLANSYLIPQVLRGSQLGTGSAIVCNTREVAVIVSTPLPVYDGWDDSALAGFMSGKKGPISTFGDGTKGRFVSYSYAKLDKITATAAEIEDIKSILYGGVYQ